MIRGVWGTTMWGAVGKIFGVTLALAALMAPASSASAQSSDSRLMFDPTGVQQDRRDDKRVIPSQPAAAPAAAKRDAGTNARSTNERSRPLLRLEGVNDRVATGQKRAGKKDTPSVTLPPLGRIP